MNKKNRAKTVNCLLLLCFFSVSAYAGTSLKVPSLSLIPLQSESNKGSIEIRPLEGSKQGLVSIQIGKGLKENIYVVELRRRAGNNYHLSSVDTKKFVLTKTSKMIISKGSQKTLFEVFLPNGEKIRAIASKDSGASLLQRYMESEFSHKFSLEEVLKVFKSKCGKSPLLKWSKGVAKRDKKRSIHLFRAMAEICASDNDYKEAIASLNSVDISVNEKKKPSMKIDKQILYLSLSRTNYILEQFSRKWLLDNL